MKGTTILLLGAVTLVAYASAHPYSKIPDGALQPDGYHYKKSSSSSNSNSFSQSNEDNADINGVFGGQSFSGSKASGYSTNGDSHSQSSSFSSGSFNGNLPPGAFGSGLSALSQNSNGHVQPDIALINPGTAGLALGDNGAGTSSSSLSSSYGNSGAEANFGGSDAQIIESAHGAGSSGGSIGAEAGLTDSGLSTGSFGSSSGLYGSAGGVSGDNGGFPSIGSASFGPDNLQPGSVHYWWNAQNSPFGPNGKPAGGCGTTACVLSGTFDLNQGSGGAYASNEGGQVALNINEGNPFLNAGSSGSGSGYILSSGSVGQRPIGSGFTQTITTIDKSKNPFLSGESGSVGVGSFASSSGSSGSSGSGTFIGSPTNPFLIPSGSGSAQIPQDFGPSSTVSPGYFVSQGSGFAVTSTGEIIGSSTPIPVHPSGFDSGSTFSEQSSQGFLQPPSSLPDFISQSGNVGPQQPSVGNPFLQSGSGSGASTSNGYSVSFGSSGAGNFQDQTNQGPSFPSQTTIGSGLPTAGYPTSSTFISGSTSSEVEGTLIGSCSGQGRICVLRSQCVNGKVIGNEQGLLQIKTGSQQCNIDREVCCTLEQNVGSFTTIGLGQGGNFASSGSSSSNSFSESTGGSSGILVNPTQPSSTSNFGQSGPSGSFGSSGQTGQFDSVGSYVQSQKKESSNFGVQSGGEVLIGSGANSGSKTTSGYTQGIPSGSSLGTPAPTLGQPTIGDSFRKPVSGSYNGANSGFGTSGNTVNIGASSQATSGTSGNFIYGSPTPSNKGTLDGFKQPSQSSGGLFGSSSDTSGEDLSAGEPSSSGFPSGVKGSTASNGYLPPIGSEPSSNVPAFSKPPKEDTGSSDIVPNIKAPPPRPPAFVPAPITVQVGCAAALICVEEKFCTLEGVISPQPVSLTKQQIERRAPLSSCRNPDNGIIGKCCRDPNYVDPWPTGNLPANYTGGFDEQGFPTYLNIAKTRPPKKQPVPVKGGFSQPTKNVDVTRKPAENNNPPINWFPWSNVSLPADSPFSSLLSLPSLPSLPSWDTLPTVPSLPSWPFPGIFDSGSQTTVEPTPATPEVPSSSGYGQVTNNPLTSVTPSYVTGSRLSSVFPSRYQTNPPVKGSDVSSGSNQYPTIIAPHTPGAHCGLRNKVQRPNTLDIDDVAFGEIPWQAMILSTTDRKLLCSGVIVAPNAVLTAAHCVDGRQPEEVSIKSGEWKLGYELKQEEPLPFEIVKVSNIVPHPGYHPGSPSYNLAILFLEHPLKLDQHVDIICLGDIPQPKPGRKCIATGWGKTILQVHSAGALMHGIDVDILSQNECKQRLQGAESQVQVDDTLTCVKAQKQRNNMCQVDVGGPLACDRGDGYYELSGVYNYETGCLPTNQVATYALIDTNWVKNTLSYPPQIPSQEIEVAPSPNTVHVHFENQVKQPAATCDCQKSYLPPASNQYLPPV